MIKQHLTYLAEAIGPRGSATSAERQAAEYCADYLKGVGFSVQLQPFRALTTFSWLYIAFYLWPLAAWLVGSPLLALLGTVLFILDLNTIQVVSRLFPTAVSQNVYARRQGLSTENPVVLVAHLDSSKAGLNFSPQMVKGFRTSFLMMVGSMFLTPILLWGVSLGFWSRWWALVPCAYLVFASFTLFHREIWNKYTHGANDNASGVAAVMAAAERIAKARPDVDLRVLLTGCEESGTYGMIRFLEAQGKHLRDASFINLDNIGAGRLHYMSGEGMFPVFKATPDLLTACRKVAERRTDLKVRQGVYTLLSTDAMPALVRGYKAISFLALDKEELLPNWHWPTDTVENVEWSTVETAVEFVSELVSELVQ